MGRLFVTPFYFIFCLFRDGSGQSGNPQTRVSFFPLPETVVRHSILCHSFLAGGLTLSELFTADFFHVSSIITIILSKAER